MALAKRYREMRDEPDVARTVAHVAARHGHTHFGTWFAADPDGAEQLLDELQSMIDQLPAQL